MSTLDLVTAIINKDATAIEGSFNSAMAEKISARLDDMRTNVAQSMFKTVEPEVVVEATESQEEESEDDDETDMDKKKKKDSEESC